ncbi:MAG: CapA family protein [Chloroflexi bacterium]|nr:CapA family protein [Chloroflexota bacterium]
MLYESASGKIDIALAGDAMVTRKLSVYREPAYMKLVDLLRGADAACCNLEMPIPDYDNTYNFTSGTHMISLGSTAQELRWMGINLASTANNHIYDYGEAGVLATQRKLDEAGIVFAGTGRNLHEARGPRYLDTAHGRVAVLAAVSYFPEWGKAGEQRGDAQGRPGVSYLRHEIVHTIDAAAFKELRRISDGLGLERIKGSRAALGPWAGHYDGEPAEMYFVTSFREDRAFDFKGEKWVRGDGFRTTTRAHAADVKDIVRWVGDARRQADWVVFSLHCHEGAYPIPGQDHVVGSQGLRDIPADHIVELAHACIDAGVDVFAGHGPHVLRGIEIYKGKPIFYSLGELVFQIETVQRLPSDDYTHYGMEQTSTPADYFDMRSGKDTRSFAAEAIYWRSMVGMCRFEASRLARIELYPIELGQGYPRPQRGRPVLAEGAAAGATINYMKELSRPFGTEIRQEGETGVIHL